MTIQLAGKDNHDCLQNTIILFRLEFEVVLKVILLSPLPLLWVWQLLASVFELHAPSSL